MKLAFENLGAISHLLSVPKLECADAVSRLHTASEEYKSELKAYKIQSTVREAESIPYSGGNLVHFFDGVDYDGLRAAVNVLSNRVDGIVVLLSATDGGYKYVILKKGADLRQEIKGINSALSGRGGGNLDFAQGTFSATADEIKAYFTK